MLFTEMPEMTSQYTTQDWHCVTEKPHFSKDIGKIKT